MLSYGQLLLFIQVFAYFYLDVFHSHLLQTCCMWERYNLFINTLQTIIPHFSVAPIPFIDPSESSFLSGDTRELVCKAQGYPTPEILWARAGQMMVINEKVRIKGNRLTILNMQRGDGGLYTCIARNSTGESRTEASLNYIGKFDTFDKGLRKFEIWFV